MSRPRQFDHDAARTLYAAGWTKADLARHFGVTAPAVAHAVDPKRAATQNAWQRGGHCPDCGAQTTRHQRDASRRCVPCAAKRAATSVRGSELRCVVCREWKPDSDFPFSRSESPARRGRHNACRACNTAQRRAYREKNRVPCSHGCGRMVLHENRGGPPQCQSCARRNQKRVAA